MAGFITFDVSNPDRMWSSANWVYANFLDHAIELASDDDDVIHRLMSSKYNQSLSLSRLRDDAPLIYNRIIEVFRRVCREIANQQRFASVNGKMLDDKSQVQFRDAIRQLNELLMKECDDNDQPVIN